MTSFSPLDWQKPAWRDKSPTMLLTGAAGGGKSRLAAEKVHAYLLKYAGATGIMGRKDKTSANKSIVPFMQYTVQGDTDWGRFYSQRGLFQYNNGSQLWVVGLRDEKQREGLRSIGKDGSVDIAWMEETNKFSESDANEVGGRMRGKAADWRQIIYTTNPDAPSHWIKTRLIDGGEASVHYSRPEDNPYNPDDYLDRLRKLTGVQRDRLWLGKWVQAEGAIYPEYEVSKHLIDFVDLPGLESGDLPKSGRYAVSVDFGHTNPFSASLWYIHDGAAYQVRQVYYSGRTVEEHVPAIKKMIKNLSVEVWITDHDAENRATLENKLHIRTNAAYKSVMPGIEAVKKRLREQRIYFVRGSVIEIDRKLERKRVPTSTIDEISSYIWSDKKQDTPVKSNDHGMDEMRYFVAWLDGLGSKTVSISPNASVDNYIRGKRSERSGLQW